MATVKVKLRPSTVPGKAGTIYYQLTHLRQVKQITTKIHLHPKNWDSNNSANHFHRLNLIFTPM